MYLSLSKEIDSKRYTKFIIVNRIGDYIKSEFDNRNYGQGIQCCIFVLNCIAFSDQDYNFDTGTVISKKYTKSQKYLEYSFKLSFKEVDKADEIGLIFLIEEGILKSFAEIGKMNIPDFDFNSFYADLKEVITKRKWQDTGYIFKEVSFPNHLFEKKVKVPKMKEADFWDIIKRSEESAKDSYDQVAKIEEILITLSENEIIGFEHILRKTLQILNTFKILALASIINNGISDDGFLMFRCSVIQAGKTAYEQAVKKADTFDIELKENHDLLLGVSNAAFIKKLGDTDKELPSSICEGAGILEDMGMTGEDWNEKDLPKLLPKLWKKYKGNV